MQMKRVYGFHVTIISQHYITYELENNNQYKQASNQACIQGKLWPVGKRTYKQIEFMTLERIFSSSRYYKLPKGSKHSILVLYISTAVLRTFPTLRYCPPRSNRFMFATASSADRCSSYSINA